MAIVNSLTSAVSSGVQAFAAVKTAPATAAMGAFAGLTSNLPGPPFPDSGPTLPPGSGPTLPPAAGPTLPPGSGPTLPPGAAANTTPGTDANTAAAIAAAAAAANARITEGNRQAASAQMRSLPAGRTKNASTSRP